MLLLVVIVLLFLPLGKNHHSAEMEVNSIV